MSENILKIIADNPTLLSAVWDILKKEMEGEVITYSMDNERLGEISRAKMQGLDALDRALKKILVYQTVKLDKQGVKNPAR